MTERLGRWLDGWFGGPRKRSLGAEGWPRPNAVTKFRFEVDAGFRLLVWWNEDAEFVGPGWLVVDKAAIEHWLDEHRDAVEVAAA